MREICLFAFGVICTLYIVGMTCNVLRIKKSIRKKDCIINIAGFIVTGFLAWFAVSLARYMSLLLFEMILFTLLFIWSVLNKRGWK